MTWREAEQAANAGVRVRCVEWTPGTYIYHDGIRLFIRTFRAGRTREGEIRGNAGRVYTPSFEATKAEWELYQ